jgi:hypothetical protein
VTGDRSRVGRSAAYAATREAAMTAFAKSKPPTELEAASILPSLNGKTARP